jgi:hypothetical protein
MIYVGKVGELSLPRTYCVYSSVRSLRVLSKRNSTESIKLGIWGATLTFVRCINFGLFWFNVTHTLLEA